MFGKLKSSLVLLLFLSPTQAVWASAGICGDLFSDVSATAAKTPTYTLTAERRLSLAHSFEAKVASYKDWNSAQLFSKLKETVKASSMANIEKSLKTTTAENLLTREDLAHTVGYIEFLREMGVSTKNMSLELRIEGEGNRQKAYLLTDIQFSLIKQVGDQKFMWSHEEGWAKERFLENVSKVYLCGQFMGMSKFVTLGDFAASTTKEQVLEKLGLKGYPGFDKPGNFYIISANSKSLDIKPMVPVIYKWIGNDGRWELATNFGLNSIPGYTSGGMSEVVIPTFTLHAENLAELGKQGVAIRTFVDEPTTAPLSPK